MILIMKKPHSHAFYPNKHVTYSKFMFSKYNFVRYVSFYVGVNVYYVIERKRRTLSKSYTFLQSFDF